MMILDLSRISPCSCYSLHPNQVGSVAKDKDGWFGRVVLPFLPEYFVQRSCDRFYSVQEFLEGISVIFKKGKSVVVSLLPH